MPCGSQLLALHTRFSSKLLNEGICFANHALIIFWRKTGMDEHLSSNTKMTPKMEVISPSRVHHVVVTILDHQENKDVTSFFRIKRAI